MHEEQVEVVAAQTSELAAGALLAQRYRIERELGSGAFAKTWRAIDERDGRAVAVKILSLRTVDHWRAVEMFEREARVLETLEHPAIPRYLDFIAPSEGSDAFVLVQALAPGRTLADLIAHGWRPTEPEVRALADRLLEVLEYLHERSPPVIHRDLKPANILFAEDGSVAVIDFGSVRDRLARESELGSVAGTFGYMAPEQLSGQATPASDLYSLGATLVHLVTHQSPAALPRRGLRIDFRAAARLSPDLERFLARLLEPEPERRFRSAREARRALAKGTGPAERRLGDLETTAVAARVEPDALEIEIRPHGWGSSLALTALFAAMGLGAGSAGGSPAWVVFAALSALAAWVTARRLRSTTVRIDPDGTSVTRKLGSLELDTQSAPGTELTLAGGGPRHDALILQGRKRKRKLVRGLDPNVVFAVEARVRQLDVDLGRRQP